MYIHVPTHQDDRRNDRLAKQAMDTHKILGASGTSHGWDGENVEAGYVGN